MCTLIYAVVPSIRALHDLPEHAVRLVSAPDIGMRLREGEVACRVTGVPECGGGGNCGTVLGRALLRTARHDDSAQASKLRRKGWSETKIRAWLEQRAQAHPIQPAHLNDGIDELGLWTSFLRDALATPRLGYLGLVHCDAGDEADVPKREEAALLGEVELARLERGVLYRIGT